MPRPTRLDEALDPTCAPARLTQLASQRTNPELRAAVAANPNAPLDLLMELASGYPDVVLANPALALALLLDPALLLKAPLASQEALARCPSLPPLLQEQLRSSREVVRRALLENPALTPELVGALSVDLDALTRQMAFRHERLPPAWRALLLRSGADAELQHAHPEQAEPLDEGEWRQLLEAGRWAHELAAAHPLLPPWAMRWMAERIAPDPASSYALQLLAQRPDLPEDVALTLLDRFSFGSLWDLLAAAQPLDRHPRLFARLLTIARERPTRVRQGMSANPTTPLATLRELSEDIRLTPLVIGNASFPASEIEALACKPGWVMRQIAAGSERLSPAALARLANDTDERVRMVVARNIHTPREALEALCHDSAPVVRERAQELRSELRQNDT